ncbi:MULTISPECIES: sugar ABC transporter ATP-binding protein [unclassified Novosphingobium]|uniref:ATP-binding cassette domain-containing protein n=1 Tax=unclassified Novosphingobium TaxID=2644732 RepID=UPI0017CAE8CF|nr:erythritol transport system ATP-binding protein [Novosphingobium sp. SG919]NMN87098.1 erythritol transport system ATP-binding protein [Novosphingobium sp. SG916]
MNPLTRAQGGGERPLMRAQGVVKRYGGVTALHGVDFVVEPGQVHVLIGENGAGKSTLMKILAGIETPTEGEVLVDEQPVRLAGVRDAAARGIGMVHQELNLCPNLTVAENIFLLGTGRERLGRLDRARERDMARAVLARLRQDIDPDRRVDSLSIGEQQIVEIAKALAEECRVLILDEPTSALSEAEVEVLFEVIADLKRQGVGLVYISHRLEELLRVGDRITVMRDGRVVATAAAADASVAWIIGQMLGEEGQLERAESLPIDGLAVLSLEGIRSPRDRVSAALHGIDLDVRAGCILGIYGLLGAGRTELLEVAIGARKAAEGRVTFQGADISRLSVADRIDRGLLFVSEDRKQQGIFANLDVGRNISLSDLASCARHGVVSDPAEARAVDGMIARLGVKAASRLSAITALSGGNQQKALIGRALLPGPKVLLLDEPTRGIDVGARAEIFSTIRELAASGLAVVFTSSDVLEVLAIADRVVVLSKGHLTLDQPVRQCSEEILIAAANQAAPALVAPQPAI